MQPSRRAFLFGQQRPRTPWEAFLQRLAHEVSGRLQPLVGVTPQRARLSPAHREDVRRARALCAEYGVLLQLSGLQGAWADGDVLEVDPAGLDGLTKCAQPGLWLAQPGCRLGDLVAVGLLQCRDAPPDWTLAAWLATAQGWRPGGTAASGVVGVELLLSDGAVEMLGPFGESDLHPLRSATVQRLVPALFQLSLSADARTCRAADHWPCRYRLDALQPTPPAEVNLAHLLLGHGGALAWVESVILKAAHPCARSDAAHREETAAAARRLQIQIKQAFDPLGLYAGEGRNV